MSFATSNILRQVSRQAVRAGISRGSVKAVRPVAGVLATQARSMSAAGAALETLAIESPHVDVVRYEHKNLKYTLKHVDHHAMALAVGLLESGLAPGDAVLSWLPSHFAEEHVLQFACSKAGLILYNLDPYVAVLDTKAAKEALDAALTLTKANALISMEAGNDVNYTRLIEAVIPETRIFNFEDGMPFITPRYPHLRLPIHTGLEYDDTPGMIPLYDIICPTHNLEGSMKGTKVDGTSPLAGVMDVSADGIPTQIGKPLTNDEVVESGMWPEFSSILNKEYSEVKGVGVVY